MICPSCKQEVGEITPPFQTCETCRIPLVGDKGGCSRWTIFQDRLEYASNGLVVLGMHPHSKEFKLAGRPSASRGIYNTRGYYNGRKW